MKIDIIVKDVEQRDAIAIFDILAHMKGNVEFQQSDVEPLQHSTGNEGEFDSAGVAWDERIHASTKTKNADGKWKKRKGVDETAIAAAAGNVPAAVGYAAPVAAPMAAPAPVAHMVSPAPNVAPPMPVVAPMVAPVAPTRDFKGLLQHINALFASKSIEPSYPNTIVHRINGAFKVNISTLTDLAGNAQYVEYAWQCVEIDGKAA